MEHSDEEMNNMMREHKALLKQYGRVQTRCTELVARQAAEIGRLQGELVRLRGELLVRETALAYLREDMAALREGIPGLPSRVTLAQRVESLTRRVQDLMRERLRRQAAMPAPTDANANVNAASLLGAAAADAVLCRTACTSHDDYWREQDQCRRTGEQCVLAEQPQAVQFMRGDEEEIDNRASHPDSAAETTIEATTEAAAEAAKSAATEDGGERNRVD